MVTSAAGAETLKMLLDQINSAHQQNYIFWSEHPYGTGAS
jgi:hypothetical protein